MNAPVSTLVEVYGKITPHPTLILGDGGPVIYFHGAFGPEWNGLLDDLAATHKVYAPAHLGSDEPAELRHIDGLWDLILYYDELFDRLGLDTVDLVGHSFGGMVAAEFAATFPKRVKSLVLIDALGLWRDDVPVEDHLLKSPQEQMALLYKDPSSAVVATAHELPTDPDELVLRRLKRITSLASTSQFLWPIPERGLSRRIHRITAPTLIIWGADDKLAPPAYAEEFKQAIPHAKIELVADAGHVPQLEQRETVSKLIIDFLENLN